MHPFFHQYSKPTPAILELLDKTVLGSNGARYRHADTREHIEHIDNPMYLTLERNNRVLGNVTFCKRGMDWYIRYFAFDSGVQSKNPTKKSKGGLFKTQLKEFFQSQLRSNHFRSFYAYIDPRNIRSKNMAEEFGFIKRGEVITQTFSRIAPKSNHEIHIVKDYEQVLSKFEDRWGHLPYFFDAQVKRGSFYAIQDEDGHIMAMANVHFAHWEWDRLPGKMGKIWTKLLPFLPLLNRLINPKNHRFLVIDSVWVEGDHPELFEELMQGILQKEEKNTLIWWAHPKNALYQSIQNRIQWGWMDRINGRHPVDIMVLANDPSFVDGEIYVNGLDFI